LVGGEDVDVVEIGEDELVGAKGGDKLGEEGTDSEGEQKGSEGSPCRTPWEETTVSVPITKTDPRP